MYMYRSTRMLARSQAPHTFTYISFGYDIHHLRLEIGDLMIRIPYFKIHEWLGPFA
jgi:hypothetical protein